MCIRAFGWNRKKREIRETIDGIEEFQEILVLSKSFKELIQLYAYLMRYGNMSLKEIRDMDLELAIELFTQISDIIRKENGVNDGGPSPSQNRFKPSYKL